MDGLENIGTPSASDQGSNFKNFESASQSSISMSMNSQTKKEKSNFIVTMKDINDMVSNTESQS